MNIHATRLARLALLLLCGSLVGCGAGDESSATPAEAGGTQEDDVRTARCPRAFTLHFDAAAFYWDKVREEPRYEEDERSQLLDAMEQANGRGAFAATFRYEGRSSGRCDYAIDGMGWPRPSGRFTTRSSRDTLQIDAGSVRYYVTVKDYGRESLGLANPTNAAVFSSFDTGEGSVMVKIGSAPVRVAEAP